MTRTTLSNQRFTLPPVNTWRGFITYAIGAGLLGSFLALALELSKPSASSVQPSATTQELISLDGLSELSELGQLAPRPQLQKPSAKTSQKNPALAATVEPFSVGVAQSYNDAGELVDVVGIDPHKSQAEQGIDDKSGFTYPCVFSTGSDEVCQRLLTPAEAAETGF